jgi:hypothetical protein
MSWSTGVIAFGSFFIATMSLAAVSAVVPPLSRRTQSRLEPVIGVEAARLSLTGTRWFVAYFVLGWAGFLPLAVWAQSGAPHITWVGLGLIGPACGWCIVRSIRVSGQTGRAASAYLNGQTGIPLVVGAPLGISVLRWQQTIARAEQRRRILLQRVQVDGAQHVFEQEVARRRGSETLGLVAASLVGLVAGMLVGIIAAQPAFSTLAGPFFLLGAAAGAVVLPLWARFGYKRARPRWEMALRAQLSPVPNSRQLPSEMANRPAEDSVGAPWPGTTEVEPSQAALADDALIAKLPRPSTQLSSLLTYLLLMGGVWLGVARVWLVSLVLLAAAVGVFVGIRTLAKHPGSRLDTVSQSILEDWRPVVTPGQFIVGVIAVTFAFLIGIYSHQTLALANGWEPAGIVFVLAVAVLAFTNWRRHLKRSTS